MQQTYGNQSRAHDYDDCHRKYWWRWVVGIVKDRPEWKLEIGKAVHHVLAKYPTLVAEGRETPLQEALVGADKILDEGMPRGARLPGDLEELGEAKKLVRAVVIAYYDYWGDRERWTAVAQEIEGCVQVGEYVHVSPYTGEEIIHNVVFRTDKLGVWHNRPVLVDHKTMAKNDLREFMKYEMELQFTTYVYAVAKLLKLPVTPAIICDALIKTQVPQFKSELYTRSDEDLAEFVDEWNERAAEIQFRLDRVARGENPKIVFYKNTKECFRYGTCPYRELCLEDTPTRRLLYIQRKRDYVDAAKASEGKSLVVDGSGPAVITNTVDSDQLQGENGASAVALPDVQVRRGPNRA